MSGIELMEKVIPLILALIAGIYFIGSLESKVDFVSGQLAEIKSNQDADNKRIYDKLVPVINGNRYAVVILCKDVEEVNDDTDCNDLFSAASG